MNLPTTIDHLLETAHAQVGTRQSCDKLAAVKAEWDTIQAAYASLRADDPERIAALLESSGRLVAAVRAIVLADPHPCAARTE